MDARELFNAGRLDEAREAAVAHVKSHPSDVDARSFLCELLCFRGDFERADKQLDAIASIGDEEHIEGVSEFRQLIRGAVARKQFFEEGRAPELIGKTTPDVETRLRASVALREGNEAEAAELLARAEAERPRVPLLVDGEPVADFRDFDDLFASVLEVLTSTGKYFWVPIALVRELEFEPPQFARDYLWRAASIDVLDGPTEGKVHVPALYHGSETAEPELQLGRTVGWRELSESVALGVGRRVFAVGGATRTILDLTTLERAEAEETG